MPAEGAEDGYLFDLYRRYIGEPDDRTDVYLGFGLFLGGIGLAAVALVLFLYASTLEPLSAAHRTWAQPSYALALVALPVVMLSIVVLLPSERRVLYTSLAGLGVTLLAVAAFVYAYPDDWNGYGADYTAEVIAIYAVGLTGLTASTGAALIAHYLGMFQQVQTAPEDDTEDEESYTDDEIRRDIDDAMEDVELSWGGVEKTEHRKLSFSSDEFDGVQFGTAGKQTRSTGVDQQVAGLKGLKGGDKKTTTSQSTVDDQTSKLKALREQQRKEQEATAQTDGALDGVKSSVTGWWSRVKRTIGN